jgi:hypothetical protein
VADHTNRSVPYVAITGYISNAIFGNIGIVFPANSFGQALCWQIGAALAITANVLAGVWMARRNDDLAAAGFTMLGIVQSVLFSSIVVSVVDYRIGSAATFLLVPALALIGFCALFPIWVRWAGLLVCVLFGFQYAAIVQGTHRDVDTVQAASFVSQQVLGLIWSFYFWREARRLA